MTQEFKYCPDCDTDWPIEDFWPDKIKSDGRKTYCKPCSRVRVASWMSKSRKENPALHKEINRRYYRKRKAAHDSS